MDYFPVLYMLKIISQFSICGLFVCLSGVKKASQDKIPTMYSIAFTVNNKVVCRVTNRRTQTLQINLNTKRQEDNSNGMACDQELQSTPSVS